MLSCAPAPGSATAQEGLPLETEHVIEGFVGEWQRIGAAQDDPARHAAIERGVRGLSWLFRSLANTTLRRSTTPPDSLAFERDALGLRRHVPGRNPPPMRFDGLPHRVDSSEGLVTTRWVVGDGRIETHWEQAQARGVDVYRLSADGARLVVDSVIEILAVSGAEPIRYRARFARRVPADVAAAPQ